MCFAFYAAALAIVSGAAIENNGGESSVVDKRTIFEGYSTTDFLYMVAGMAGIVVIGLIVLAISRTCSGKR